MAELPGSACWKGLLPVLRFLWRPTAAQAAVIPGCTATVSCSRWIAMPTEPPPHLPQFLMMFDINLSVILLFAQTKYMCEVSSRMSAYIQPLKSCALIGWNLIGRDLIHFEMDPDTDTQQNTQHFTKHSMP